MAHDHVALHSHAVAATHARGHRRRLAGALAVLLCVMALELVAGVVAHSLALLSDAAHMLTDAGAIGFSLFAISLAARPARAR